ncbi:MAG: lyase family protein [Balneolaceae bacterium]
MANAAIRDKSKRILEYFSDKIMVAEKELEEDLRSIKDLSKERNISEKAWLAMLIEEGIVKKQQGKIILDAIAELEQELDAEEAPFFTSTDSFSTWSLEKILTKKLGADLAGNINIGKTLPEPIARLKIRNSCIGLFDTLLELLKTLHYLSGKYQETIMPGYTHIFQAQITTFGHYLLSVYDSLFRALEELESAYSKTNMCTLGCGALSGTSWPIDRQLVSDFLGFYDVLENTNDCVSTIDYCISLFSAMINITLPVNRVSLDLHYWCSEEIDMINVPESFSDTSSMMPQKKNSGAQVERIRMNSATIIGRMQETVIMTKNEPFADMLAVLQARIPTLEALVILKKDLKILEGFLLFISPKSEKMEQLASEGFSSASEFANILVRKEGISYRQAHHIVGTVVRKCSENGIKGNNVPAEIVNQAAQEVLNKSLNISDEEVRIALSPEHFINSHDSYGGVAPKEMVRMLEEREIKFSEASKRQLLRKKNLADAQSKLEGYLNNISK